MFMHFNSLFATKTIVDCTLCFQFKSNKLFNKTIFRRLCDRVSTMEFATVVDKLKRFAPVELAESWDNVGVLVEPPNMPAVSKLLLTNDLTLAVMDEAERKEVQVILSYHPPIFKPLKSITTKHWKELLVGRCLARGVAVYSPHTCFDAKADGVNDWLIRPYGVGSIRPAQPGKDRGSFSHKVILFVTADEGNEMAAALTDKFGGQINVQMVNAESVDVCCGAELIGAVLTAARTVKSDLLYAAFQQANSEKSSSEGVGRVVELSTPVTVGEAVRRTKQHLRLAHVRLAVAHGATQDTLVKSVAVCAGSGASVLCDHRTDLWVTGELSHHETLEATQRGTSVILCEHSNTERGYLRELRAELHSLLENRVDVIVSEADKDPLVVV